MADPANPSGAPPGDPRHGLSEAELEQYYRDQRPSWIVRAVLDEERGAAIAADVMDEHLAYLRSARDLIRFAGPVLDPDDTATIGSLWLVDADDRPSIERWVEREPFAASGAFRSVQVTRWSSSMQLRQGDYPRTPGWEQFAITALDGPEARERRAAVAEPHHAYHASVMDRYLARGPMLADDGGKMLGSFMLVEFPDIDACVEFWSREPLNTGGVFTDVTIERWRYGAAIG